MILPPCALMCSPSVANQSCPFTNSPAQLSATAVGRSSRPTSATVRPSASPCMRATDSIATPHNKTFLKNLVVMILFVLSTTSCVYSCALGQRYNNFLLSSHRHEKKLLRCGEKRRGYGCFERRSMSFGRHRVHNHKGTVSIILWRGWKK